MDGNEKPSVGGERAHGHEKKTYWTCGMHPKIVQDEPGTCPICGMDLLKKTSR